MAWIESHQELLNHPKTLRLMNMMEWDINTTIGMLHRFWWWCMNYAPDGDLRRHNASQLAAAVGLPGAEAKKFVRAMLQARWLDTQPYFRVHDWWEYAGPFLQAKHKRHREVWQHVRDLYKEDCSTIPTPQNDSDSTAQTDQVHQCYTGTNEQIDVCSTSENLQTHRYCAVPPNQPNLTLPDLTKPNLTIPNQTTPDITKQKKQQQQQNSAADAADHNAEHPGRHQQQFSQTQPLVAGAAAVAVNPGDFASTPPLHAYPGNDPEQIIYDRVGDKTPLSRHDFGKLMDSKTRTARSLPSCIHPDVSTTLSRIRQERQPADTPGATRESPPG